MNRDEKKKRKKSKLKYPQKTTTTAAAAATTIQQYCVENSLRKCDATNDQISSECANVYDGMRAKSKKLNTKKTNWQNM